MSLPLLAELGQGVVRSSPILLGLLNLLLEGRTASDIAEIQRELKHLAGHQAEPDFTFEDTDPNAPGVQVGVDFIELQEHLETERAAHGCGCDDEEF